MIKIVSMQNIMIDDIIAKRRIYKNCLFEYIIVCFFEYLNYYLFFT